MTVTATPILRGSGYFGQNGNYMNTQGLALLPSTAFPSGQTIGGIFEMGDCETLRLTCAVSAKSGTSPTLDVTIQCSKDGTTSWRSLGTFRQKSDVLLAMEAVAATGTTPPTVTLTGTATEYVDFRMECTTLGARGTAVVRYSTDGGVTWTSGVATAATIVVNNSAGAATGLTINYANATAAVDNVWTCKPAGYEEKSFSGCDRFVRAVVQVGGSATPIMTASVAGEVL